MKRGIRILVTLALACALGLTSVQAQEQDGFLQRYELAMENLDASVAALPDAASVAREELDRAVNALRTLARETDSGALVTALERIFERAREAIMNQSAVDLSVQVEVLRGGFQRLVYDAALQAAIEGDLPTSRARLQAVAGDIGVPDSALTALGDEGRSIAQLRYAFEAGIAQSVRDRLATARDQAATDLDAAYQSLADAYGDYLLVQDSPRMPGEVNAAFVDAANALVDTQMEPLVAQLDTLVERFAALQQAATDALESAPAAPEPSEPSQPAELPATQSAAQPEGAAQADAGQDQSQQQAAPPDAAAEGAAADPGQEGAVEQDVAAEPAAEAAAETPEEIAARVAEELAQQERQERIDALVAELGAAGVAETRRQDLAARILDGGYLSLEAVVRDLYADASEAADAVERGRPETARGYVRAFAERYRQFLGPVVATVAPETDRRTTTLTGTLATADGVRLQDVAVLSSQAGTLRDVLAGVAPTLAHQAAADTVQFWAGLVRLAVVLVLGVLAFVPLYLLNLAFGGGNRNWRLVGVALFLLLVPVIYEALAALSDLIAATTGIDALYAVSQYSMFHNPISQIVWAALTGAAILFAIGGLYGICVQFGLLGRRKPARAAASSEVRDTVDWDEEF